MFGSTRRTDEWGNEPVEYFGVRAALEGRIPGEELCGTAAALRKIEEVVAYCWQEQEIYVEAVSVCGVREALLISTSLYQSSGSDTPMSPDAEKSYIRATDLVVIEGLVAQLRMPILHVNLLATSASNSEFAQRVLRRKHSRLYR